jgi:hypothetical protein
MAKSVLFLLHGVGDHDAKWADKDTEGGPTLALRRAWRRYSHFQRTKQELEEFVEFVPILYNDVFDTILEGWSDLPAKAYSLGGSAPNGACQAALEACEEAGNDKNKLIRYGGDVVLYKAFRLFAQRVQMKVIDAMTEIIAPRIAAVGEGRVRFFVMAHSLGTTVAHDALHHLASEDWLKAEPEADARADWEEKARRYRGFLGAGQPFRPPALVFDAVFMVSNTSRLLYTTDRDPYSSWVVPYDGTLGNCGHYFNFDHVLDPISKFGRFRMPDAWKAKGAGTDIINLEHLHAVNLHAYDHYLNHPRVHLQVLSQLVPSFEPTGEDLVQRRTFPKLGTDFGGRDPAELARMLETLVAKAVPDGTADDLRRWLEVYRELLKVTGAEP